MIKVCILSCSGISILEPLLKKLNDDQNITCSGVIIDGHLNDRDREIEKARLDQNYKIKNISEFNFPKIPFYFLSNHNSDSCIQLIKSLDVDYILNAGTPRILKKSFLTSVKPIINSHPGILPEYRGCTSVEWSIYNGDSVGVTAHFIEAGIDEGPIIMQEILDIKPGVTYEIVRTKILFHQVELMYKALIYSYNNDLSEKKLPSQKGGNYYKPIPFDCFLEIKEKLTIGKYYSPCKKD